MATEHSEAFHNNCVINLCRICSKREKLFSEKRSSIHLCEKFKDEILVVFGVNISNDEGGKHPIQLCTRCHRRMINRRRNQGGKPQSEFVSSAEKSGFALIDNKWSVGQVLAPMTAVMHAKHFVIRRKGAGQSNADKKTKRSLVTVHKQYSMILTHLLLPFLLQPH